MAHVLVERRGPFRILTLDDPERYNALTSGMVTELKEAFAKLRDDRDARVVILTANGKGFCSGANMAGGDHLAPMAQDRGPVGTGSSYTGFLKRYSYDTRLLNSPPPKFPTPRTTSFNVATEIEVKTAFSSTGAPLS